MKTWKKTILSISGVFVLTCGAFFMPLLISRYEDNRDVDDIKKIAVNNVDVFKYDEQNSIEDKLILLSNIYSKESIEKGDIPEVFQMAYHLDDEQRNKLEESIKGDLAVLLGEKVIPTFDHELWQSLSIMGSAFYSVYNSDFTYLEVFVALGDARDSVATIYMDSSTNKIYLIVIEYPLTEWEKKVGYFDAYQSVVLNGSLENYIQSYYGLSEKGEENYKSYSYNDWNVYFQEIIAPNVCWRVSDEINDKKKIVLYIGIRGFETELYDFRFGSMNTNDF